MIIKVYNEQPYDSILSSLNNALDNGKLVILPLDRKYAIVGDALNVQAINKICEIKGIQNSYKVPLTLICKDISQISEYAKLSDTAFKLIKKNTPGPFTFILPTGSSLPKQYKERKEVGVRIAKCGILDALLPLRVNPLIGSSIPLDENKDEAYGYHPELIEEAWNHEVEIVIDAGEGHIIPSAIIDLTDDDNIEVLREGPEEIKW